MNILVGVFFYTENFRLEAVVQFKILVGLHNNISEVTFQTGMVRSF